MNLFWVAIIVFVLNLPFGYWRGNVKKFSLQWILAIHLPVPAVILLRFISGIGFAFITYPVLVGAFFAGQFAGKIFFKRWEKNKAVQPTSCLLCDLYKYVIQRTVKQKITG